jgi:hypothetical protein
MLASFMTKYRRSIGIAGGVVVVYTLVGFFLVPWLVEKNATDVIADTFGAELRIEKVAFNPFVLSLRVNGIELEDPSGAPFLRVAEVFANFQLSSLFRRAWTFDEVRFDAPEVFLARAGNRELNAGFLATQRPDAEGAEAQEASESELPRLLIFDFAINESVINWSDEVPVDPVVTRFGPVNIAIAELNTLPDRSGQQEVVITTATNGTLAWSGSLSLNPPVSEGHASIKGSHFPLTSAYLKHEAGFEVVDGTVDLELDYAISVGNDGAFDASVANLKLSVHDVLISTFNQAFGINEPDREVLRLPLMMLSGGTFDLQERRASAQALSVDDAIVSLYRDVAGRVNILPPVDSAPPVADSGDMSGAASAPATEDPWQLTLAEFEINRMAFELEDDSVDPAASIGYRSLDLSIRDISNAPAAVFPMSLKLLALSTGSISMDGTVAVLPAPDIRADLRVENLALSDAHSYVQQLVDVNLDSGALNFSGNLASSDTEPLLLTGDLQIVDFLITETDEGSRLGSWTALNANKLTLSAANQSLEISEIRLDEPYADIVIAEDGSVNLGRVQKGEQREENDTDSGQDNGGREQAVVSEDSPSADSSESPLAVTVGRVVVANAAADFADFSLPLPFEVKIAELNGELSTIATASAEPSTVSLEGKVDEFGLVRVTGHATPVDPSANTDIRVVFENVEMPKFSAYSVPFAGREIASGRLDLDLGYKVTASELEGENTVVLRDFELGDKVEHPGAMSLPLGLAVALLKDADGRINIDLPVRGNVDDPDFQYGGVVLKALGNLLTGIVTSPFRLLGNLVGAESSDLEYLQFADGRSDLTPPELEKSARIAEALAVRPELMLQIAGVVDPDADGAALKAASFNAEVERRIAALMTAESDDAMYANTRLDVIEQLYRESGIAPDPSAGLVELRAANTVGAAGQGVEAEPQLDALAYTENLRRLLLERQPLAEQELPELAAARASNARVAIIGTNPELGARIELVESSFVSRDDDEAVRMQLSLTTSAGGS